MATYLDKILDAHRASAAADGRHLDALIEQARQAPPTRGFAGALRAGGADQLGGAPIGVPTSEQSALSPTQEANPDQRARAYPRRSLAVIAEIKRRSPSKGDLFVDLDPVTVATAYAEGGAACLSVLTDTEFFGGSPADLARARSAVGLPVLRKDFTVSAADVCDARLMGADAVLLIAAALDDTELADFHALAVELGLDALVEIHDEAEAERALGVGASLIGVNQRDLVTFDVDQARAVRVAVSLPADAVRVAESGISGQADAAPLLAAGYHAVLVGESLVTSGNPAKAVTELRLA